MYNKRLVTLRVEEQKRELISACQESLKNFFTALHLNTEKAADVRIAEADGYLSFFI